VLRLYRQLSSRKKTSGSQRNVLETADLPKRNDEKDEREEEQQRSFQQLESDFLVRKVNIGILLRKLEDDDLSVLDKIREKRKAQNELQAMHETLAEMNYDITKTERVNGVSQGEMQRRMANVESFYSILAKFQAQFKKHENPGLFPPSPKEPVPVLRSQNPLFAAASSSTSHNPFADTEDSFKTENPDTPKNPFESPRSSATAATSFSSVSIQEVTVEDLQRVNQEQDVMLNDISALLESLEHSASMINAEVQEQNERLDGIDTAIESSRNTLQRTRMRKVERMLKGRFWSMF